MEGLDRLELVAQQVSGAPLSDHEEASVTVIAEGPCALDFNWQAGQYNSGANAFASTDQVQYTCSWGPVGEAPVRSMTIDALNGYNYAGYITIIDYRPYQITWTLSYKSLLARPSGTGWGYLDYVSCWSLRDIVPPPAPFSPPSKTSVVTDSTALNAKVKAMSRADIRPGTTTPLLANINAVQQQIALGRYDAAAKLLKNTVLTRMDGYATKGAPDSNDFVTSQAAQKILSMKVQELITDLTWLQMHPS